MRPILFNTDMVRAILSGSKTVTRRICRDANKLTVPLSDTIDHNARTYTVEGINDDGITQYLAERRMPYAAGDILWVRETWAYGNIETSDFEARANESWFEEARFPVKPFGEYHVPILFYRADMDEKDARELCMRWRPSIHMPKEAARLFLRVTGVRVERLQESFFDQGDAPIKALQNEGIDIGDQCRQCIENYGNPCCNDLDPELEPDENGEDKNGGSECGMLDEVRSDFAKLWDNTVKPEDRATYGWEAHPWVFVIEFERISKDEALGGGRD